MCDSPGLSFFDSLPMPEGREACFQEEWLSRDFFAVHDISF